MQMHSLSSARLLEDPLNVTSCGATNMNRPTTSVRACVPPNFKEARDVARAAYFILRSSYVATDARTRSLYRGVADTRPLVQQNLSATGLARRKCWRTCFFCCLSLYPLLRLQCHLVEMMAVAAAFTPLRARVRMEGDRFS